MPVHIISTTPSSTTNNTFTPQVFSTQKSCLYSWLRALSHIEQFNTTTFISLSQRLRSILKTSRWSIQDVITWTILCKNWNTSAMFAFFLATETTWKQIKETATSKYNIRNSTLYGLQHCLAEEERSLGELFGWVWSLGDKLKGCSYHLPPLCFNCLVHLY